MALYDNISDFLTKISNAQLAVHRTTKVLFFKVNSNVRNFERRGSHC